MRLVSVTAAGALMFLSGVPAHSWGSLETTYMNAHRCLDVAAYDMLANQAVFDGAVFPKIEAITANEGVVKTAMNANQGPGPDAEGSSFFSEHYYNPLTGQGRAPRSVTYWFVKLATGSNAPKAAAWGAHFLADISVPYHGAGLPASQIQQAYLGRLDPNTFNLPADTVGRREFLSRPLVPALPVHSMNFQVETGRFFAAAKDASYLDWFDPWYWNGTTPLPYVSSSHLMWEGVIKTCPSRLATQYSPLWPGNPVPDFQNAVQKMGDVVGGFTKAVSRNTYNMTSDFLATPDHGMMQAAETIATLWRASFSALRVGLTYQLDPQSVKDEKSVPVIDVQGRLQNFTEETAANVQLALSVVSGSCKLANGQAKAIVPVGNVPFSGARPYGAWRVNIPDPKNCRLMIEAIGRFAKTPDLQYASRQEAVSVTLPVLPKPKPVVQPPQQNKPQPKQRKLRSREDCYLSGEDYPCYDD